MDVTENYFVFQGGPWNDLNIFVQKLDETGSFPTGWTEEPKEICTATGNQGNAKALMTPDGLLIVWEDLRAGTKDIYGQMIDVEGNILWQADGIPMVDAAQDQVLSDVIYENDIYLTWQDFRNGEADKVFTQRFDTDGMEIWADNGIETAVQDSSQIAPFIIHRDYSDYELAVLWSYNFGGYSDLFFRAIDTDGNFDPMHPESGEVMCNALHRQQDPKAVMNNGDVLVVWDDMRSSGKTDIHSVYAQKMAYVSTNEEDIVPAVASISQNYPNPFNPTTTISYNLSNEVADEAKLVIYNLKGQKVKIFSNEEITESPNQQITWNGTDSKDKTVSSGLYFYRIESGKNSSETKKMVLLK
jgi:hypothetical protein